MHERGMVLLKSNSIVDFLCSAICTFNTCFDSICLIAKFHMELHTKSIYPITLLTRVSLKLTLCSDYIKGQQAVVSVQFYIGLIPAAENNDYVYFSWPERSAEVCGCVSALRIC